MVDLTAINSYELKEEVFNLLFKLDDDPITENETTRIIYHSLCSIRIQTPTGYLYKLQDCTSDGRYKEVVNKYLIYLLKEEIKKELITKPK